MSRGKVLEYNVERGFGSIIDDESGQQLRVYANYLNLEPNQTLKKGLAVEYDVENIRNGQWVVNVKILK